MKKFLHRQLSTIDDNNVDNCRQLSTIVDNITTKGFPL